MEQIERGIAWIRAAGRIGLFGVAFLDSAGLPTGGGPDLVLLLLSARSRGEAGWVGDILPAVAGSALGCLVFYAVGRWGGRRILRRFEGPGLKRAKAGMERFGPWAVGAAVMAPPPYPMKLFVLSAGLFRMPVGRFLTVVVIGRTLRYGAVGFLAARYGERAAAVIQAHSPIAVGGILGVIGVVWAVRRQGSRRRVDSKTSRPEEAL